MKTTKLFIELQVREGERTHDHKVLIETKCKNLEFAANYYVAHFWGYGERMDAKPTQAWYWWGGEICGTLIEYKKLSEKDYHVLKKYL